MELTVVAMDYVGWHCALLYTIALLGYTYNFLFLHYWKSTISVAVLFIAGIHIILRLLNVTYKVGQD